MRIRIALILCFALILAGCIRFPDYRPTERALVSIFNESASTLEFKAFMSGNWTDTYAVRAGEAEILLDYERSPKETQVPTGIDILHIKLPDCMLKLNREGIEQHMLLDREGRPGWNLYVTDNLIRTVGCSG